MSDAKSMSDEELDLVRKCSALDGWTWTDTDVRRLLATVAQLRQEVHNSLDLAAEALATRARVQGQSEEIAKLREALAVANCDGGEELDRCSREADTGAPCDWHHNARLHDKVEARVAQLEAGIKFFLSLARKLTPGETPEQAVWHVPDRQLTQLGEALKP